MISAVSPSSDRTGGLVEYITGVKRSPTDVPVPNPRPRLDATPGGAVPGLSGKPPSSSQRPGKPTNQVVSYPRVSFADNTLNSAFPTSDILPGDVVFVNKHRGALGRDTNKPYRVASWRQINALLKDKVFMPDRAKIIKVREAEITALDDVVVAEESLLERLKNNKNKDTAGRNAFEAQESTVDTLKNAREQLKDSVLMLESGEETEFVPVFDWASFPLLSSWAVDGVLLSRDDDEQNASSFHSGGGDSGVALNIAVQGPCALRNAASSRLALEADPNSPYLQQFVDPNVRICDTVYMMLICNPVTKKDGSTGFSFEFKPTSTRVLEDLSARLESARADPEGRGGVLNMEQYKRCVSAVKVGRIFDSRLVSGGVNAKVGINTSVSQLGIVDLMKLLETFKGMGREIGDKYRIPADKKASA